jgi:hypothetical protein
MKRYLKWSLLLLIVVMAIVFFGGTGWDHYGNDTGGQRFSLADQITAENVGNLEVAWQYSIGDAKTKPQGMRRAIAEGTPILAPGRNAGVSTPASTWSNGQPTNSFAGVWCIGVTLNRPVRAPHAFLREQTTHG